MVQIYLTDNVPLFTYLAIEKEGFKTFPGGSDDSIRSHRPQPLDREVLLSTLTLLLHILHKVVNESG